MSDPDVAASTAIIPAENPKEFGTGDAGEVARWLTEISLYEAEYDSWEKRVDKIEERYRGPKPATNDRKKLNVLWSNIETSKPAVYARPPAPDVQRRYKDSDPMGRQAAQVLERALSYSVDMGDLDSVLKQVRDDYLLGGRGVARARYEFKEGDPKAGADGKPIPTIKDEKAPVEHLYRKDFGHTPARCWKEVRAVWFKAYLTRDKLIEKFGEEIGKAIPLDTQPTRLNEEQRKKHAAVFATACIYEIWDKEEQRVLWIARSYHSKPLKKGPPPTKFDGFFPCPEPLYATLTNDTLEPVPDFAQYQDQADEIDDLTGRISLLLEAVRVAGVYDGSQKDEIGQVMDIARLVSGGELKNQLIPIKDWGRFTEKGGLKGSIDWVPLDMIVAALKTLYEAREAAKQALYEISGIGDIVRGQGSDSRDVTATEQKIKGQFATMRLDERQKAMARFARDCIRLMAEIIAEQFSPETLSAMTGVRMPMTRQEAMMQPGLGHNGGPLLDDSAAPQQANPAAPPPSWEDVMALLRDDLQRGFRIDIETDSTIALDEEQDKQDGMELLNVSAPFFEKMALVSAQAPMMLPLMGETFRQVIRRFKLGRNIEDVFDQTIAMMQQAAQQPRPNPEEEKLKLEAEKAKTKLAMDREKGQQDIALKREETSANIQLKQAELQADLQMKGVELQHEMQMSKVKMAQDAQLAQQDHAMQREHMQAEHGLAMDQQMQDHALKQRQQVQDHALAREGQRESNALAREKMQGDQKIAAQKARSAGK